MVSDVKSCYTDTVIHRFENHGLLGTTVELRLWGPSARQSRKVERGAEVLWAEIERLQAVFSTFDPASELCRWRSGLPTDPSPEFRHLLGHVLDWWERSGGTFNPLAGRLSGLWAEAEASGRPPDDGDLASVASDVQAPCYSIIGSVPVIEGDCRDLNLNAIAKGYIVDRSLDVLAHWARHGGLSVDAIVVNAGGDVCHNGTVPVTVGIENPLRPYDNEPPSAVIELHNRAVATSGGSRRGFHVGGRRYGHLLDPRTGKPVEHSASVSVVAPDAMTADVVATAAAVMTPTEAVSWIDSLDSADGLVIEVDGSRHRTAGWPER